MAGYFAIFLVLLTLITGLIWLIDAIFYAPKRREKIQAVELAAGRTLTAEDVAEIAPLPKVTETAQSLFPVIAAIMIFRSFIYEPFQIPSGSMMPTLLVGDFILVEKFAYDIKDPVWRKTLYHNGKPRHGDVAVFKYPEEPTVDYIKRIVGLPGDRIIYRQKQLYIQKACYEGIKTPCGELEIIPQQFVSEGEFFHGQFPQRRYSEQLGEESHEILITPASPEQLRYFYMQPGVGIDEFIVPAGHYFAMGDNRDNSRDSRFWGFVPEDNLVGKAVFIWMSFEFSEDPNSWVPGWLPVGIRFSRLGPIH